MSRPNGKAWLMALVVVLPFLGFEWKTASSFDWNEIGNVAVVGGTIRAALGFRPLRQFIRAVLDEYEHG